MRIAECGLRNADCGIKHIYEKEKPERKNKRFCFERYQYRLLNKHSKER